MKLHLTDEQIAKNPVGIGFDIAEKDSSCLSIVCQRCGALLTYAFYTKEGVRINAVNHSCVIEEEKPVNEACLFKPVLVSDNADFHEAIFVGMIKDDSYVLQRGRYMAISRIDGREVFGFSYIGNYKHCKRIPGYDYGD